jgi:hypothetical protein
MDAKPFDESRARRRRFQVLGAVIVAVILGLLWWNFRFWPEEQTVNHFFQRIEAGDLQGAYGIWMADPNWKQHPQKYARYNFGEFSLDWGPTGEYGVIHSHKIVAAGNPPGGAGSGVIVAARINERPDAVARIWVEKSDKSLSFPP